MSIENLHSSERSPEHQQLLDALINNMNQLEKPSPDTMEKLSELSFPELQKVAQRSERQQATLQVALKMTDKKKSQGFQSALV